MLYILCFIFLIFNCLLLKFNKEATLFSFSNMFVIFSSLYSCVILPFLVYNQKLDWKFGMLMAYQISMFVLNFMIKVGGAYSRTFSESDILEKKVILKASWIMLGIGALAFFLFGLAYGGYKNYIEHYALALRAGIFVVHNKWSFLQPFCEFPTISTLVFLWDLLDKDDKRNKFASFVGLCVSAVLCYYMFLGNKARLAFLIYMLILAMSLIDIVVTSKRFRSIVKLAACVIAFSSAVLVSQLFGRGAQSTAIETLTSSVSFVFHNFEYWFNNLSFKQFRFFIDYILSPLFLLPSRFWSGILHIHTISENNTLLQMGAYKGTQGITGEIPMDFLSCVYCQLGGLGLIIFGLLWGNFLRTIYNKINSIPNYSARCFAYYYIVLELIFRSFSNGDPEAILTRIFPAIAFLLLYRFLKVKVK